MAKTLKDFLNERQLGPMVVKNPDEQKFIDKHVTAKTQDRNGNGDDVFNAANVKKADRKKERHGYEPGDDEKVYEGYHVMRNGQSISYHQDKESADKRARTSNMRGGSNATVVKDDRSVKEELKGNQHKIDANKNGKVDAHDFHLLRKKKKVAEEVELDEASVADVAKTAHLHVRAGKHDNISTAIQAAVNTHFPASIHSSVTRKKVAAQALSKIQSANSSKMTKEEAEELDEKDAPHVKDYGPYGGRASSAKEKMIANFNKPKNKNEKPNRYTKEETEELEELSTATLRNYRAKAKDDAYDAADVDDDRRLRKRSMGSWDAGKKILKRGDALRKEETELEEKLDMKKASMGTVVKDFQKSDAPQFQGKSQKKRQVMAIAAKLSAERGGKPLNKEERLLALLGDLSETHQRTMTSVFDKLNEDNQRNFLAACDTPEGIDQMLDFSIQNRGA